MGPQGTRDGHGAYHLIREPNSIILILPIQVRSRCEYYSYLGACLPKSHSKNDGNRRVLSRALLDSEVVLVPLLYSRSPTNFFFHDVYENV